MQREQCRYYHIYEYKTQQLKIFRDEVKSHGGVYDLPAYIYILNKSKS